MLNRIKIRACWKEQRLCGDNIWEKQVLDWIVVRHRSQLDSNADVKAIMTVVACEIKRIKRAIISDFLFFK